MDRPQSETTAPLPAMEIRPVPVGDAVAVGIQIDLPKTRLLVITTGKGYIMCGALDVDLLNTRLAERGIVAGRALGVRRLQDLLDLPLIDVTDAALALGIQPGMTGRAALERMF